MQIVVINKYVAMSKTTDETLACKSSAENIDRDDKATENCMVQSTPIDSNSSTSQYNKRNILVESDFTYIDEEDKNSIYVDRLNEEQENVEKQSKNCEPIIPNKSELLESSTTFSAFNKETTCPIHNANFAHNEIINDIKEIQSTFSDNSSPNILGTGDMIAYNCDSLDSQQPSYLKALQYLQLIGNSESELEAVRQSRVYELTDYLSRGRIYSHLSTTKGNCSMNPFIGDYNRSSCCSYKIIKACDNEIPLAATQSESLICKDHWHSSIEEKATNIINDCGNEQLTVNQYQLIGGDENNFEKCCEENMTIESEPVEGTSISAINPTSASGLSTSTLSSTVPRSIRAIRGRGITKCAAKSATAASATVATPLISTITSDLNDHKKKPENICCVITELFSDENNHPSGGNVKEIICTTGNRNVESDRGNFSSVCCVRCDSINDSSNTIVLEKIYGGADSSGSDPYMELQTYLEKVKHEINAVFELQKMQNNELPLSTTLNSYADNYKLTDLKQRYFIKGTNRTNKLNNISGRREFERSETTRIPKVLNICNEEMKAYEEQDLNQEEYLLEMHHQGDQQYWQQSKSQTQSQFATSSKSNAKVKTDDSSEVNIWANAILKELNNVMRYDVRAIETENDHVMSTNKEENRTRSNILKPEKHTTIPLYSFNLDKQLLESSATFNSKKPPIDYTRKLMAVGSGSLASSNSYNNKATLVNMLNQKQQPMTVLKIEENGSGGNHETKKTLASGTVLAKIEIPQPNILPLNNMNKNGSNSTIWTSEESIVMSIGAVDEDNKSTSSSICDEVSGVISSSKSRNSLDSSELDFENECSFGKETLLQKTGSERNIRVTVPSRIDDPDLLEVLSLCGGTNGDDDLLPNDHNSLDWFESKSVDNEDIILRKKIKNVRSHSIESTQFALNENDFGPYENSLDEKFSRNRPVCLQLNQNHSCNIRELPSPSSASLHSGNANIVLQQLTTKSNSAPILLKNEKQIDDFGGQQNSLRYSRSQSDRYLAEIEAIEACKWLRAAGFPQYAHMYEDLQFPIDLNNVANDHPILENDPLQSLYRRLCILNRCASMRLNNAYKKHGQQKADSDDEVFALSEKWTFQPQSRRWSRIGDTDLELSLKQLENNADCSSKDSSPDRFDRIEERKINVGYNTFSITSEETQFDIDSSVRFRRTGSDRIKNGAKALLRRVESINSRRRKRQNREGLVISGPQVLDLPHMNQRVCDLKCIDITSTPLSSSASIPQNTQHSTHALNNSGLKEPEDYRREKYLSPYALSPKHTLGAKRLTHSIRTSPLLFLSTAMPHLKEGKFDDSSSYYSDSQESSSGVKKIQLRRNPRSRRFLQRTSKVDDIGPHSDSECHGTTVTYKDANANDAEVKVKKLNRGGSLNLGKESKRYRDAFQPRSFRSRSRKSQTILDNDQEDGKYERIQVVRWHSFQDNNRTSVVFKKCVLGKPDVNLEGTSLEALSCGQLQILRKLALVTLTGYMERYCPSHRSGWNWELPKFIKKIKTPDYKDKRVFGVPLLLGLQRTGQSLPKPIRSAFKWLELNALDQIGIFRKSGVKSRISKLKQIIESSETDCLADFDANQAYDVADVLKQYFRDLPESLLTAKMSETFVAIFQHLPREVRSDAIQSAVLLLPDENREVLHVLLKFLREVSKNSQYNQMTSNNLAVCFAPSVFNNGTVTGRSHSVSPRRRKSTGVPEIKELSEARASHECFTFMISNHEQIFTVSLEKMLKCKFGYMEESKPLSLEALGEGMQFRNWRGYLYESTSATIKEGREKSRGWINTPSLDPSVEIAYKKVGDDHPLRLWRCITEVEAPPSEVLNYILNEREAWDVNLLQSKTLKKLDERTEIFQYCCEGQSITDYCILRSWQHDLPRGVCVIVETSIDHSDTPLLIGGVQGVVLASRYLIEPSGCGRSRLMHLARVDTMGRTPDWYNKSYGHICCHYLTRIRKAFRHVTNGPESKV